MYKASQKAEWDEHARITTATEIGEEAGLLKGEAIGLKKGREEERFDIAKNLLAKGIELQIIMEATGLSEEDIKKL